MLICEEMNNEAKSFAISYLQSHCRAVLASEAGKMNKGCKEAADMFPDGIPPLPWDYLPDTGVQVKNEYGRILVVAFLYLEKSSKMSVIGNVVANPVNTKRESYAAIEQALCFLPNYAKSKGAAWLQTFFGNRGICDIAESLGYKDGDPVVRNQLLAL